MINVFLTYMTFCLRHSWLECFFFWQRELGHFWKPLWNATRWELCVNQQGDLDRGERRKGMGHPVTHPDRLTARCTVKSRKKTEWDWACNLSTKMSVNHPHCKHDNYYSLIGIIGYIMYLTSGVFPYVSILVIISKLMFCEPPQSWVFINLSFCPFLCWDINLLL